MLVENVCGCVRECFFFSSECVFVCVILWAERSFSLSPSICACICERLRLMKVCVPSLLPSNCLRIVDLFEKSTRAVLVPKFSITII